MVEQFVGEHSGFARFRTHGHHLFFDDAHGLAFVQNVIQNQHIAASNVFVLWRAGPAEIAAFQFVAIARNVDVIEIQREAEQRQQFACKHHRAAHHRQYQWIRIAHVLGDFSGHAFQCFIALGFAEQQISGIEYGLGFFAVAC